MDQSYYIVFMALLISACNLNKWDLDDQSDFTIPNYSSTIDQLSVVGEYSSSLIAIDDDTFVTAVETVDGQIVVFQIVQSYVEDNWLLESEQQWSTAGTGLAAFDKVGDEYVLVYDDAGTVIKTLSSSFEEVATSTPYIDYVNQVYNRSDSIEVTAIAVDTFDQQILLAGFISSFETKFSYVMGVDIRDLSPTWLRVYERDSQVSALGSTSASTFIALHQSDDERTHIISDDETGRSLRSYSLQLDGQRVNEPTIVSSGQSDVVLGLTNEGFGSIYRIDLAGETALISQVKNYELRTTDFVLESDARVVVGGSTSSGAAFMAEVDISSAQWCNDHLDRDYIRILDIIEAPGKGFVSMYIVDEGGNLRLHLLRTDEEGATSTNAYNEFCAS